MPHLPAPGRPVPTATYRVQLHQGFTFDDAAALLPYLAGLGVSHVYCSPVLQAVPGSMHGYDVVDHARLSDDLGGAAGFDRLVAAARDAGLGVVVDVVPNHMAIPAPESQNRQLWDVLARGPASPYAHWFDVDWEAQGGRLLMPVLGAPLGECLASGDLRRDGDLIRYHDHVFPVAEGTGGLPLPELLDAQHYRLAFWRVGNEELNYRRFFDVTTLAGVRVEQPDVFAATHELLLGLVRDGRVDGLRVDHPDGLADPSGYLERLSAETGGSWVVAEKILEADERLPDDWACAGTTGYDALNQVLGVLTDPAGERPLTDLYASLTGAGEPFPAVVEAAKRQVVEQVLVAEVDRLTELLTRLAWASPDTRDLTRRGLREALVEVLVDFGVYRAYVGGPDAERQVAEACAASAHRRPDRAAEVEWIGKLALGRGQAGDEAAEFAMRFGQTTGPVMAKGVEDTAFYRYGRLVALNEVGGDPGRFGRSPAEFHAFCTRLARDWPATMTTLSTHDTKRSEDVRARLLALAEVPVEWAEAVVSWRARRHFGDPQTEYFLWQTLAGAWPIERERLAAYAEKASREAKRRTSWTDPDPGYDAALQEFVTAVFDDAELLAEVDRFVREHLLMPGRANALAQKLVQLTMPGVPDVYQGSELWDLSLVDPDNRRPVDYRLRERLLAGLDSGVGMPDAADDEHGAAKLLVVTRALRLRGAHPEWFGPAGGYQPLETPPHLLGFVRGDAAATLATRLPVGLARRGGWGDETVRLPGGEWQDQLTGDRHDGGELPVRRLLERYPVALLVRA